ncbi:MAG: hypothetical protein AVDCRST_MAG66-1107 [uncultured Pseudonocardia sp.]|uniref:Tyr recombinase domain-containing protein n=1 Tax=uncultured Pseudonocardia sp. TaxID=211455 RepID=A0A6J4NNG8_9PSEU|nr:MAG: hypothetical protein AVDCRST_MAG66-1107 [uncultured Pseudonocardia sp.]
MGALAAEFGESTPVAVLDTEAGADRLAAWFRGRWGGAAAATVNLRLDALRSAAAWWREQGWITGEPARRIRRRPRPQDRTRAIDRAELEAFLTREDHDLRERLLYESAARAEEVLGLDVAEVDRVNRRAKVRCKGGTNDIITWRTGTARLLPRYLQGRETGPLLLTDRRARLELAATDLDPGSGRARLSYRRAAELFDTATPTAAGGPWTLHQLRHSALTHAAEDGANTSTMLSYSGHTAVASLSRYTRVSADALARWQSDRDPATAAADRQPGQVRAAR